MLVSARISRTFVRRVGLLDDAARGALVLAATSDSGDLAMLERAAEPPRDRPLRAGRCGEHRSDHVARGLRRVPTSAGPVRDLRRRARRRSGVKRTERSPRRCPIEMLTGARGTSPPLRSAPTTRPRRHWSRPGPGVAIAARTGPRRPHLSGPHGSRSDPDRRARLLWEAADAGWLAGMADRAVSAARRGAGDPPATRTNWSKSISSPATSRCAAGR